MARPTKTKADFAADEKWIAFGEAYIEAEGNIAKACRLCDAVSEGNVYRQRRENPEFIRFLEDVSTMGLGEAVAASDARLTKAGVNGEPIPAPMLKTQDQLYRRTEKIKTSIQVNNTTNITSGDPLADDMIRELIEWKAAQLAREKSLAERN
jgi:hypothetical protein